MEAIILAGGLGTRLREAVSDVPKSMAPIQGRPFLETLIDYLIDNGVNKIILSVGYKSAAIQTHFGNKYKNCEILYSVEETQLGTGGAVTLAMKLVTSENVIVANGDTVLLANVKELLQSHIATKADVTLALKPMQHFERYGTVQLDEKNRITAFVEKRNVTEGIINGGFYVFNVASFLQHQLPQKFSLEKEIFEAKIDSLYFNGVITNGYFIDIGIPADYNKAQIELGCLLRADKSWTLFLDRDGVINKKIDNDYVRSLEQFQILPGVIDALVNFSHHFGRIIIVTNQQGVGKGLMTAEDVNNIHNHLTKTVAAKGGKIDAIYFAPQLVSENSEMRKPNIGMALQAEKDFPAIDFNKSLMVGDSPSDMKFARSAGIAQLFIAEQPSDYYTLPSLVALNDKLTALKNPTGTD